MQYFRPTTLAIKIIVFIIIIIFFFKEVKNTQIIYATLIKKKYTFIHLIV